MPIEAITVIIIVVVGVGIGVVIGTAEQNRRNQLLEQGLIIKRSDHFSQEKSTYITTASFPQLIAMLGREDLSKAKVTLYAGNRRNQVIVSSAEDWKALLTDRGTSDGKNRIEFVLTAWKERAGLEAGWVGLNRFMTIMEKTILRLDPDALVETQEIEIQTR